jgi:hypothetical protein
MQAIKESQFNSIIQKAQSSDIYFPFPDQKWNKKLQQKS